MLIYVDDNILIENNTQVLTNLISPLSHEFAFKNLGSLYFFLVLKFNTHLR